MRAFLVTCFALVLACGSALADDADLAQYNRPAANAEAANVASALTGSLLLVRDGKKITADSNGTGSAPVNRSIKQLADQISGVWCATFGNCMSVNMRTMKAVQVDGSGGAVSTAAAGTIVPSLVRGGATLPQTANPPGVVTKDSPVFGYGNVAWSGVSYSADGGFNLNAINKIGTGIVDVTFANQPANVASCSTQITAYKNAGAVHIFSLNNYSVAAGKVTVRVDIRDTSATLDDAGFAITTHCAGS